MIVHDCGPIDQIPPGEGRNFRIGEVSVAIFRTQSGELFATQPECPHRAGPLADGLIGGHQLICPLHERSFDLRTGEGPDCRLRTYPVAKTDGDRIAVTL